MIKMFKYINTPTFPHSRDDVMTQCISKDELAKSFVVFNSETVKYIVFKNYDKYASYTKLTNGANMCYNEVIFGNAPQKLKFDIDIDAKELYRIASVEFEDAHAVYSKNRVVDGYVSALVQYIYDLFYIEYRHFPTLLIFKSHADDDVEVAKWSYHIIIDGFAVWNNIVAQQFTSTLTAYIPADLIFFIDAGVNKSTQNFRLIGCTKPNQHRLKRFLVSYPEREDCNGSNGSVDMDAMACASVITNVVGCVMVGNSANEKAKVAPAFDAIDDDCVRAVVAIAKESASVNASVYSHVVGNLLVYKRTKPAFCDLCARIHDHDNTFLVMIARADNGETDINRTCRRSMSKLVLLDTIAGVNKNLTNEGANKNEKTSSPNWLMTTANQYIKMPVLDSSENVFKDCKQCVYESAEMRKFDLAGTMYVKAQMKMGKTKQLVKLINDHFSADYASIIFISFRQTFSSNIKERFPEFTLYSDVKGALFHRKKIVQVESLHRIPIKCGGDKPDLIILDESESIIEQFNSGLLKNFNAAFAVFSWLMKYSAHVICMDAKIGERTFNTVNKFRPSTAITSAFHYNKFKKASEDTYKIMPKPAFLASLLKSVRDGKRICVPVSSLAFGNALYTMILEEFPDKKVYLYSSETLASVKKDHFANINVQWKQYDVLIYTPTISAGISFEEEHYDLIYGYFTHFSCPVETCLQMIGRVRNVRDKLIILCIDFEFNSQPTARAEILKQFSNNREVLFHKLDAQYLSYEYKENGAIEYADNAYLTMWIENVRIKNLSFNNFLKRIISYLTADGARVEYVPTAEAIKMFELDPFAVATVLDEFTGVKEENKVRKCTSIAQSLELSAEDVKGVQERMMLQEDILVAERDSYEKYKLRVWYRFDLPMSCDFVADYSPFDVKMAFKNLQKLVKLNDFGKFLSLIQAQERNTHLKLVSSADLCNLDVNKTYNFGVHRALLEILMSVGVKSMDSTSTTVVSGLNDTIVSTLRSVVFELKLKKRGMKTLITSNGTRVIRILNDCLDLVYKMRLARVPNNTKNGIITYCIEPSSIFSMNRCETKPQIIECIVAPIVVEKANVVYDGFVASSLLNL